MTLIPLKTYFQWPGITPNANFITSSSSSITLDAAGEYSGLVIRALEDMTISHVFIRNATVTSSPVIDIRIETVDPATGFPSTTLFGTNSNISPAAITTSNQAIVYALTTPVFIAAGQTFAIKIAHVSGGSIQITKPRAGASPPMSTGMYAAENTGTPTLATVGTMWAIALGSSATTFYYIPYMVPWVSDATVIFDNTTAGAQRGMRFRVPFKGTLKGLAYNAATPVAVDKELRLYDDAATPALITSVAIDGDLTSLTSGGVQLETFPTAPTIEKDTWYRLVLAPTEAANIRYLQRTILADTQTAMPGDMNNYHAVTYTTAGGWVTTDIVSAPTWDLWFDQIDIGGGGGFAFASG